MAWELLFRRAVGHPDAEDALVGVATHAAFTSGNIALLKALATMQADPYPLCRALDKHGVPPPGDATELVEVRRVKALHQGAAPKHLFSLRRSRCWAEPLR